MSSILEKLAKDKAEMMKKQASSQDSPKLGLDRFLKVASEIDEYLEEVLLNPETTPEPQPETAPEPEAEPQPETTPEPEAETVSDPEAVEEENIDALLDPKTAAYFENVYDTIKDMDVNSDFVKQASFRARGLAALGGGAAGAVVSHLLTKKKEESDAAENDQDLAQAAYTLGVEQAYEQIQDQLIQGGFSGEQNS